MAHSQWAMPTPKNLCPKDYIEQSCTTRNLNSVMSMLMLEIAAFVLCKV